MIFATVYGSILLVGLDFNSVRWDELVHCFGGWQLLTGHFYEYLTTNTFYPPMFNLVTAGFFGVGGVTVLSARLATVLFSVLSIIVLFELTNRLYGSKTAFLAAVFFGVMPGVLWVSRFAYIETMLEFFFLLTLFFFFTWIRTNNSKVLVAAGLTLGLGFLVKYQMLVAGLVMLLSLLVFGWSFLKSRIVRLSLLFLIVLAIVASWFLVTYLNAPGTLNQWLYAISTGDQLRFQYSTRYPMPIFYLVEMVWIYSDMHPISLLMYAVGLSGLAFLALRKKREDKLLLVWFAVVYSVFTLIGNRQWRYVMTVFPVLAISGSSLLLFVYGKFQSVWQKASTGQVRKVLSKISAILLIVFSIVAIVFSGADAFHWISKDQVNIPIREAINYVSQRVQPNESILVVCPYELFSAGIASFYLQTRNNENNVLQYPALPVDTFAPAFNIDEIVVKCQQNNVKYILMSEYQWAAHYFNSTLTPFDVTGTIFSSGKFDYQTSIEKGPSEILVFSFK